LWLGVAAWLVIGVAIFQWVQSANAIFDTFDILMSMLLMGDAVMSLRLIW